MSIATWKAEFYPIDAFEVPIGIEAIKHSLQKWIGLRPENLKKHSIAHYATRLYENAKNGSSGEEFLGMASCSLCFHYFQQTTPNIACVKCPLYTALGGKACDRDNSANTCDSPWSHFMATNDPEPMIAALEKALKNESSKIVCHTNS